MVAASDPVEVKACLGRDRRGWRADLRPAADAAVVEDDAALDARAAGVRICWLEFRPEAPPETRGIRVGGGRISRRPQRAFLRLSGSRVVHLGLQASSVPRAAVAPPTHFRKRRRDDRHPVRERAPEVAGCSKCIGAQSAAYAWRRQLLIEAASARCLDGGRGPASCGSPRCARPSSRSRRRSMPLRPACRGRSCRRCSSDDDIGLEDATVRGVGLFDQVHA